MVTLHLIIWLRNFYSTILGIGQSGIIYKEAKNIQKSVVGVFPTFLKRVRKVFMTSSSFLRVRNQCLLTLAGCMSFPTKRHRPFSSIGYITCFYTEMVAH